MLVIVEMLVFDLVPHPIYLGRQVLEIQFSHSDDQGHPLNYVDTILNQLHYLVRIVCEQADTLDSNSTQYY